MSKLNDVSMFLEGCDWASLGLSPKNGNAQVVSESREAYEDVNESDDLEAGFYEVDGELFFVNEHQDVFDVFTDEEEQIFIFHENYGVHQVYEDNEGLLFEAKDDEGFEILEEDFEAE